MTNITGQYRQCEEATCKVEVSCPYVRCKKHWIALANVEESGMKEKIDTGAFI